MSKEKTRVSRTEDGSFVVSIPGESEDIVVPKSRMLGRAEANTPPMNPRIHSYLVEYHPGQEPDDSHPFTKLPEVLREKFLHDPWTEKAEVEMKHYIGGYIHRLVVVGLISPSIEADLVRFLQQSIHPVPFP
jgi:hypothetical protein